MSQINIKITASPQDFIIFADELGYQDKVYKTPEELALLVEPISIQDRLKDNPQSKVDFLTEYFKNITVTELARVKINAIQNVVNASKEVEKANMRASISDAVTIQVIE